MLALDTHCLYYAGASGVLHGWFVGLLVWCLFLPQQRLVAAALLVVVLVKMWLQSRWDLSLTMSEHIPLYAPAHVAGALGGAVASGLLRLLCTGRRALAVASNQSTKSRSSG